MTVALKPAHNAGFVVVDRGYGACVWLHESRQVWVVSYNDGLFFVFRATRKVPKNREPWTTDNRSVGDKTRPFRALDDALEAARNAIAKEIV